MTADKRLQSLPYVSSASQFVATSRMWKNKYYKFHMQPLQDRFSTILRTVNRRGRVQLCLALHRACQLTATRTQKSLAAAVHRRSTTTRVHGGRSTSACQSTYTALTWPTQQTVMVRNTVICSEHRYKNKEWLIGYNGTGLCMLAGLTSHLGRACARLLYITFAWDTEIHVIGCGKKKKIWRRYSSKWSVD